MRLCVIREDTFDQARLQNDLLLPVQRSGPRALGWPEERSEWSSRHLWGRPGMLYMIFFREALFHRSANGANPAGESATLTADCDTIPPLLLKNRRPSTSPTSPHTSKPSLLPTTGQERSTSTYLIHLRARFEHLEGSRRRRNPSSTSSSPPTHHRRSARTR